MLALVLRGILAGHLVRDGRADRRCESASRAWRCEGRELSEGRIGVMGGCFDMIGALALPRVSMDDECVYDLFLESHLG